MQCHRMQHWELSRTFKSKSMIDTSQIQTWHFAQPIQVVLHQSRWLLLRNNQSTGGCGSKSKVSTNVVSTLLKKIKWKSWKQLLGAPPSESIRPSGGLKGFVAWSREAENLYWTHELNKIRITSFLKESLMRTIIHIEMQSLIPWHDETSLLNLHSEGFKNKIHQDTNFTHPHQAVRIKTVGPYPLTYNAEVPKTCNLQHQSLPYAVGIRLFSCWTCISSFTWGISRAI